MKLIAKNQLVEQNNYKINPERLSFWVFVIAILFSTPNFIQYNLTNSGWLYFLLLIVGLTLIILTRHSIILPAKKNQFYIVAGISCLIFSSIINNAHFTEERWIQRYIFLLATFVFIQLHQKNDFLIQIIKYPLTAFLLAISAHSIFSYVFICAQPIDPICFSSSFWNINMLSQALVLSMPFLLLFRQQCSRFKSSSLLYDITLLLVSMNVILSGCRSSILALVIFFTLQIILPFIISRTRSIVILFASVVTAFVLISYTSKQNTSNPVGEGKLGTANYRLEIWKKSLDMSFDSPLGIGVNNFEFGFLPYKRDSNLPVIDSEIDKYPHNEFLRILAEEGWAIFLIFCSGFIVFLIQTASSGLKGNISFLQRFILIALPEFIFQFPTGMYFPMLLFSIALAIQLSSKPILIKFTLPIKLGLIVMSIFLTALFLLRTTNLVPAKYSTTYCSIFNDNWTACSDYFETHFYQSSYDLAGSAIKPILKRQPFNSHILNQSYRLTIDPTKRQELACNYYWLFNNNASIAFSDVEKCAPEISTDQLKINISTYAEQL